MNFIHKTVLLAPLLLAAGCMKTTITTGAPAGAASDHKAKFFLYGLVGETNFNVDQICPTGVSKIEESAQFGDLLLSCVTCSIYTPRSVTISCASGSAYMVTPDEEIGRSLVEPVLASNLTVSE